MNRSNKLEPIARIRKHQERSAGRAHGETIRKAEHHQQQLNELIGYRQQYTKSFQDAIKTGLSAIRMQEYMLFIKRLDDAISQQKNQVTHGKNSCDKTQKDWMSKRGKSKMIDKVMESRQHSEQQSVEKRQQKELEDRPHKQFNQR